MSWVMRQRLVVLVIAGSIFVAVSAVFFISILYQTPTCTDHVQNQNEEGVDCGGSCLYACATSERAPRVLFARLIDNGTGRLDVVALIENKNINLAAVQVPYTVDLYRGERKLRTLSGVLALPPRATVPLYLPGAALQTEGVVTVFVSFKAEAIRWFSIGTDPRTIPTVSNTVLRGSPEAPRVEATLSTTAPTPLDAFTAVVFVRDASGSLIGASSTVIPVVPAQGKATALFTWNGPFSGTPVSVEVFPVIPLPESVLP